MQRPNTAAAKKPIPQALKPLRPPAVPLVVHDPYFSIWSFNDRLTDDWSRHWTGKYQGMYGMLRVDERAYRFMGAQQVDAPAMEQVGLEVLPTRTIYRFEAGGVQLALTFLTPLLPFDLDVMSRPVTYVVFDVRAIDGKTHRVSVYFDCGIEATVNMPSQKVVWGRCKLNGGMRVLRAGSLEQPVLKVAGDDLRIDWGYLHLAVPGDVRGNEVIASSQVARSSFTKTGALPEADDMRMPRAAQDGWPVLACTLDLGEVTRKAASAHMLLAYDDQYSIEYLGQKLRPYWRRDGMEIDALLQTAERQFAKLHRACRAFDQELMDDLRAAGGEKYARLCALASRQCIAAHKLAADARDGSPLLFSKENFSNGCIATVDVTYPSAPFFLLFNPQLVKAMVTPVMDYARSRRWKFPFAPHDLGTYPLANGQVYGGGELSETDQMPVEECGNMLLLVAALTKAEGNGDYARAYWPLLTQWARYLKKKGLNPERQLCTDDFAGHLSCNTNLSLKAILALASYAWMARLLGEKEAAQTYRSLVERMARQWVRMADEGDHYRLAFDRPGTWSQKYNLVWDRLLGLNLFPADVARKEAAFYLKTQTPFGLPLDNRKTYTKLDWIVWSATLAERDADFRALVDPLYDWADQSPSRVPLTDWYETSTGRQVGFQARSVVGGILIKLLYDAKTWKKWLSKGRDLGEAR